MMKHIRYLFFLFTACSFALQAQVQKPDLVLSVPHALGAQEENPSSVPTDPRSTRTGLPYLHSSSSAPRCKVYMSIRPRESLRRYLIS